MIKEYEEVKRFVDTRVSSKYLDAAVVVDDIFTDEYNALDIRIIGDVKVSQDFFLNLKNTVKHKFEKIIENVEILRESYSNQVSILVYLKSEMEIRTNKINKIKSKMVA